MVPDSWDFLGTFLKPKSMIRFNFSSEADLPWDFLGTFWDFDWGWKMPSFTHIQDLAEEGLSIGFRPYVDKKTKELVRRTWMARTYIYESKESHYTSLKINYEDSAASTREAQRKAGKVYREIIERVANGLKPRQVMTLEKATEDFFKEAYTLALRNKEFEENNQAPRYKLAGANSPISLTRYNELWRLHQKYVQPFFEENNFLKINVGQINSVKLRGYKAWIDKTDFRQFGRSQPVSPSVVNKSITVVRLIWEYAMNKGFVNYIPTLDRAEPKLADRKRKTLTEDIYTQMILWAQENYENKPFSDGTLNSDYHQDLAEQFYIFIKLISWVGFRPPRGSTSRTLLRWNDIEKENVGTENERWFLRRTEKVQEFGKSERYIIQKPVWKDLRRLQEIYEARGISDTPYIFAHTHDSSYKVERGENIGTFRYQWKTMLTEIGHPNQKNAPQSERLSFYSIRGYYITCRIDFGKVSVADVAKMCNTSAAMVEKIYRNWDESKLAPELSKGIPEELL